MNPTDLLKLILPDFLVDYFEIISVYNSQESLHLYFEEKAKPPKEFDHTELVSKGLTVNYQSILNYFDNRSTNAAAESFNAKIKAFRSQFRGVRNIDFFLFRLSNLFA